MRKVKIFFNIILVTCCSFILGIINSCIKGKVQKVILIPYANILGDIVLFLDCLDRFDKIYHRDKGYEVRFLCKPEVKKILLTIYPDCRLNIEIVDWHRFGRDIFYYWKVIHQYSEYYDQVIVPYDHTITNDLFVRSIRAKEKLTQEYKLDHRATSVHKTLGIGTYTCIFTEDRNISVLQRQKELLRKLGDLDFCARMPYIRLLENGKIDTPDIYCVICPTASYMPKRWSLKRFAQAIDYLVEKYHCKICICGGNEEPDIFQKFTDMVKHTEALYDYVCKTNFAQWVELIRGAKLALCNDSASYHIAAATRTPAVCIAGDFALVNAPYYKPDTIIEADRIPLVIYKEMPCGGCRYMGYRYGYGNTECTKAIHAGKELLCVDCITVEMVIEGLEKQINKYNIFSEDDNEEI